MKYTVNTPIYFTLALGIHELKRGETLGELTRIDAETLAEMSEEEIRDEIGAAVTARAERMLRTDWGILGENGYGLD